jgi:hypothetical protein
MQYIVRRASTAPRLQGDWDGPAWRDAAVADITHFHAASSDHRPRAQAKMLYDESGIYLHFRVSDRFVVCQRAEPQSMVCKDSCVEAFLQPAPTSGYFNFEMNCGGTMLAYYVTDPTRRPGGGLEQAEPVAADLLRDVRIFHSIPQSLPQEIAEPLEWSVEYFVPNGFFERYIGKLPPAADRRWRGNFYKCADESSHPHWGSWAPIGAELNFHQPEFFAPIRFES